MAAAVSLLHEAQAYADLDAAQRAGVVRGVRALLAREAAAPAPAGRVPAPGPRAPLEPRGRKARGVVFFDLETSGLSPNNHRIIEVAAQGAASGRTFATLVNPGAGMALSPKIVGLTGISDAAVHAPSVPDFSRAAVAFQEFVAAEAAAAGPGAGDAAEVCLVAHNGRKFDVPFLAAEFRRAGLELPPEWTFFDSYLFSRDALAQAGAPSSAAPPLQFNLQVRTGRGRGRRPSSVLTPPSRPGRRRSGPTSACRSPPASTGESPNARDATGARPGARR